MLLIKLREILDSFLLVRLARGEQLVVDDQDTVCDGHGRALATTAYAQASVLCPQVGLRLARSVGGLHQGSFHPPIALARPPAHPFPATFVLPRTQAGPGGQMRRIGKWAHIPAHSAKSTSIVCRLTPVIASRRLMVSSNGRSRSSICRSKRAIAHSCES